MLTLLFNRFPKRRLIGLLALGEWGPPTGAPVAITGSGATQQARQQDLASGTVLEPVVTVVGGGGGGGIHYPSGLPAEVFGSCKTRQAKQQSNVDAAVEFPAYVLSQQHQETLAAGDVLPAIYGECHTGQRIQRSRVRGELEFVARVVGSQLQESVARGQECFVGLVESRYGLGRSQLDAQLAFSGAAHSATVQESVMVADMVDTELEIIAAIMMEAA